MLTTTCGCSTQPVSPTTHGRQQPPLPAGAVQGRRRSLAQSRYIRRYRLPPPVCHRQRQPRPRSNQHTMWLGSRRTYGTRKRPHPSVGAAALEANQSANASPSGVRCRGGRATDLTAAHAHGGAPGIVVVIGHDPHRIFREPLAAARGAAAARARARRRRRTRMIGGRFAAAPEARRE